MPPIGITAAWRRVRRLAQPYARLRGWIALAAVLGAAVAALGAVEPLFLKALTDLLVRAGSAPGTRARDWRSGLELMVALAVVLLLQRGLQTAQAVAASKVRFRASFELSTRVLRQLYRKPLGFHQATGAGYVLTRVDRGIAALGELAGEMLQTLLPNTLNLGLMAWLLWRLSPRLALVAMAPMPFFLWATAAGARRTVRHESAVQEGWSRLYGRVTEVLGGIKTVKSLGGEEAEVEAYRGQARGIFRHLWRLVWENEAFGHAQNLVALGGRTAVGVVGFGLVLAGGLSPGGWIAATTYAALLYGPLAGLAGACSSAARHSVAAGVVLDFLEEPEAARPEAAAPMAALRGGIEFDRVGYAYAAVGEAGGGGARAALEDVSFRIEPGESVAIIGPSGGGKTTLMDLLLGFHEPTRGVIRLDGRRLGSIAAAQLREQIAVVLQEPFLLQGSIADNLAYAAPRATPQQMQAALRAAQAEAFVARLPQGLETRLGERGARLSGGERQRLAIARALLRDPRILLLDEASAHLDAESEAALNLALRRIMGARTVVLISHRLATLPATDRIVVLDQGRVQAQGTPAEVARRGGFYGRWRAPGAAEAGGKGSGLEPMLAV